MFKKSLKNTILINIGAFLLVTTLELLSGWMIRDKFDTDYSFYLWGLNYALVIMAIIWVNHFVFIPYFLDKKRYLLYVLLLFGCIFIGAYLKGNENGWTSVYKLCFFLLYTTGTGMAAFFLRRNMLFKRENEEKEKPV